MSKFSKFSKQVLSAGSALQAVALISTGMVMATAIATPAMAQDYTNVTASGKVVSTSGEGISGATVTYTSNDQGFSRSVTTDSSGGFRIGQLPAGEYSVSIESNGYDSYTANDVNVGIDDAANQFALAPTGSSSDVIVVTAGRVKVADFDRTTTGAVIEIGDLSTRVPVARSISSVVQLSPGTTAGDAGFGDQPNIAGASVAENAFYLNGLNITNFRTGLGAVAVPFDFYKTVEVKNGGYQAEFGRATGGVVNAITKSGSNTFHGGITVNWEPASLANKRPNTIFEDNDVRKTERRDVIAQLSGPIIKDRLFFYGIYQARDLETNRGLQALAPGTTPANPTFNGTQFLEDRNRSPFYGAKIDAIITDGHRVEGTYFNTSSKTTRTIFGTVASGLTYNPATNNRGNFDSQTVFRTGGENYALRYTGVFAPWITVSAAYGKNKDSDTTESTQINRSSISDERSGTPIAIGNSTANSDLSRDQRIFYRGDVDLFFNALGSHHIRGGYDREDLSTDIVTLANGGGQLTYTAGSANDPFGFTSGQYVTRRFFQNGGNFKSQNVAFYLQDNWALFNNRLTLQLGVRNDRFENKNIAGTTYFKTGNQWAPRLGFSADVFGDRKTKVYGSFGRYFLPVAANTNNRLGGAELDYDQFFTLTSVNPDGTPNQGAQLVPTGGSACPTGVTGTCVVRSDGIPGDIKSLIAGNLKAQSLDEYIIGAEHRFSSRFRVGVFFTKRDLTSTLEDAAVDAAIRTYCTANNLNGVITSGANIGETCQTVFNGTHQYVLLNPGSPSTITLSDAVNNETSLRTVDFTAAQLGIPVASRKYRAVTIQADREFDGVWSLSGSYTWSTLKGNTEGGVRSDNDQDDTGATVDFDLPGLADGTFGFSPNHRRHNLKLYGSYAVTNWLTFGFNASVVSPRKFGCLGTVPASRDADANAFYGANGTYCNLNADGTVRTTPFATGEVVPARQIVQRGTAFNGEWQKTIDFDLAFKLPSELFGATLRLSVNNVLNSQAKIDFEERGTLGSGAPRITYGQVRGYQAPRTARIQFGVNF
jgi:hypothetical protein